MRTFNQTLASGHVSKPIQMQIRSNKTLGRMLADSSSKVRLVQGPCSSGGKQHQKERGEV